MEVISNIESDAEKIAASNYLTPKQLPQKYPAFTESSIRYMIFHEHSNGFHRCIRRVGKKILISEKNFIQWIEAQCEGGAK